MARILSCVQCTKKIPDDEAFYRGPKFPCCSEFCSKLQGGDRSELLSICSGPLPPFKDFLRTAIRAGDKTQTRRIVKIDDFQKAETPGYDWMFRDKRALWNEVGTERLLESRCPYGLAGQVRYLREPLAFWRSAVKFREIGSDAEPSRGTAWARYRDDDELVRGDMEMSVEWRWKNKALPQIFMPKEYARTFVYMKDIRIEKLQDITEEDAVAEGCRGRTVGDGEVVGSARADFARLWHGINGKGSWESNQWVWVLEFQIIFGGTKDGD